MVKQLRVLIGMQIEYQPIKSLCVVNKADGNKNNLRVLIGMQIEYQPIKSLSVVNKADGKTIESIDWHADWISTN